MASGSVRHLTVGKGARERAAVDTSAARRSSSPDERATTGSSGLAVKLVAIQAPGQEQRKIGTTAPFMVFEAYE